MHPAMEVLDTSVQSGHMNPVRLLLVDDHLMVTEALASRFSAAMDIWVAGRCATTDPSLLDIVRGVETNCESTRPSPSIIDRRSFIVPAV